MSLDAPQLDDLNWQQMVDAIRTRITANSDGEWTMHGPLDPGVTLLELFAYLFEQRLFWLDQLSAPQLRALMSLLDDAPLRTQSARTLFSFSPPADFSAREIAAHTLFNPRDNALPLPFSTSESINVLPLAAAATGPDAIIAIELHSYRGELSNDLRAGRPVALFPADGSAATLMLTFWFARQLQTAEYGGRFNLFFDLQHPATIAPEWAPVSTEIRWFDRCSQMGYLRPLPDATPSSNPEVWLNDFIDPEWSRDDIAATPPVQLSFAYSGGAGSRKQFTVGAVRDGSAGLRRSGILSLKIPTDWQPVANPASGPYPYRLWLHCESATYSSPPTLLRLIPNTVVALQQTEIQVPWLHLKPQLESWLRLPGQFLQLPITAPEPLEDSVRLSLLEADGDWHEWRVTDHVYHHGPADRIVTVDRTRKQILFGDGLRGRIPVLQQAVEPWAQLSYLAGGGRDGNIGSLIWRSKDTDLQPRNQTPGIGGTDAETIDEAKARVAADLSRRERAVTADDYSELVLGTPGIAIARAHPAVGFHPDFPCHPVAGAISLFVVPEVPRDTELFVSGEAILAPQTDPGALAEIRARLDNRRLLGSEVHVLSARYRAVYLQLYLQGIVADEEQMRDQLHLSLTRFLDPLVGGEHQQGWPFGAPLRSSALIKQLQQQLQDGIIIQRIAIALDRDANYEDCNDVTLGANDLVYLHQLTIHFERRHVATGGIQ